jgi:hypothetical protein
MLTARARPTAAAIGDSYRRRYLSAAGTSLLLALAALFAAPTLLQGHRAHVGRDITFCVVSMVLVGTACIATLRSLVDRRGTVSPFHVGETWVVYFTITFGVTALGWLNLSKAVVPGDESLAFRAGLLERLIDRANIPAAILLSSLALLCWTIGFALRPFGPMIPFLRRMSRWSAPPGRWTIRFRSMPIVLYVIGIGARVLLLLADRYAYLGSASLALTSPSPTTQVLGLLGNFALYGLILAMIDHIFISRSLRSRLVFVALLAVELGFGLFGGNKGEFLLTAAAAAIVYSVRGGRITTKAVVGILLAVLVVFPFVASYRNFVRPSPTERRSPAEAFSSLPTILHNTLDEVASGKALGSTPKTVAWRLREIDNVAIVTQKTPAAIPYRPWEDLVVGPVTGMIPRAVWPSKPVLSTANDFEHQYYETPSVVISASAITWPGDLYRHGGIAPVVIGMLVLGAIARLVQTAFHPAGEPRKIIVFVALLFVILQPESDVTSSLLILVQTGIAALLVTRVAFRHG